MVQTYALSINNPDAAALYQQAADKVPPARRTAATRFLKSEDTHRCIYGECLARYALIQCAGLHNEQIDFHPNEFGKPGLISYPVHFNISHSGYWVACAVSDQPVGIDVERITEIDLEIARLHFSPSEYNDLLQYNNVERQNYFFDLWTLKESYIKMRGQGLSIPLDSFSIRKDDHHITLSMNGVYQSDVHFKQYTIDDLHKLSVCAAEPAFGELNIITIPQMLWAI